MFSLTMVRTFNFQNTFQSVSFSCTGTYPLKPSLPAVGGNEGVGEVIEVGKDVQSLNTGDQIILRADQCLGILW